MLVAGTFAWISVSFLLSFTKDLTFSSNLVKRSVDEDNEKCAFLPERQTIS